MLLLFVKVFIITEHGGHEDLPGSNGVKGVVGRPNGSAVIEVT